MHPVSRFALLALFAFGVARGCKPPEGSNGGKCHEGCAGGGYCDDGLQCDEGSFTCGGERAVAPRIPKSPASCEELEAEATCPAGQVRLCNQTIDDAWNGACSPIARGANQTVFCCDREKPSCLPSSGSKCFGVEYVCTGGASLSRLRPDLACTEGRMVEEGTTLCCTWRDRCVELEGPEECAQHAPRYFCGPDAAIPSTFACGEPEAEGTQCCDVDASR